MKYKKMVAGVYCIVGGYVANAQIVNKLSAADRLQYGFALQASVTVEHGRPALRIVANAGIGYEIGNFIYPTYNYQIQLYNGGHGTRFIKPRYDAIYCDMVHAFTLTIGGGRSREWMNTQSYLLRNSPLYYFTDFCYPALQHPYNYSVSLGSNFINSYGSGRVKWQQAGYVNGHVNEVQLAYSNDGTPFHAIYFGDGRDRHYTGDGFVAIHLPKDKAINILRVSYHKFTGYTENAFEVANGLFLNDVVYADTSQQYFNRSVYSFGAGNAAYGIFAAAESRNHYHYDMQHNIHKDGYYTLHQMPYRYAWGFSGSYFFSTSYNSSKK